MGGLISFADARDVPEGGSPRNWDVDYDVGSVYTRPGLQSVYTYATTLNINSYALHYGLATFGYSGPEPTVNEVFVLGGFTGALSYLNGLQVTVESVTMTTFTAFITGQPDQALISNLTATAISLEGVFLGPNLGSNANSTTWVNPNAIYSSTLYASVVAGPTSTGATIPSAVVQNPPGIAWGLPSNLTNTGSLAGDYAFVLLTPGNKSETLFANGTNLSVPLGATITGISVSMNGIYGGSGVGSVVLQLTTNGFPVGTPVTYALNTILPAVRVSGSSLYQWGTTFTPTTVNGTELGINVYAVSTGNGTAEVNQLSITVYYTTGAVTDTLTVQGFGFSLSLTSGVTGFVVTLNSYTSTNTSLQVQLVSAGVPVGIPKVVALTTTPTPYILGGPDDAWGYLWSPGNINSPQFGVQLTAMGTGTTFANDLDVTTYVTTALENYNWFGSYEQNNDALTNLALDAAGNLWKEDAVNNPGVFSLALSGIVPNSFANGATLDNSEFIMFSDLTIGTDRPRQLYSDGLFYPVSQVGPGAPPKFQSNTGAVSGTLILTSYDWTAGTPPAEGTMLFTFQPAAIAPAVGDIYVVTGTGVEGLDNQAVIVTSLTPPTTTSFTAEVTGVYPSGVQGITGKLVAQFFYDIQTLSQPPQQPVPSAPGNLGGDALWFWLGSAPGIIAQGTNVTVYYAYQINGGSHGISPNGDVSLITAVNNAKNGAGPPVYVQIEGATLVAGNDYNGIWLVTNVGTGHAPGFPDETLWYFTFTYTVAGATPAGTPGTAGATYQQTVTTATFAAPGILGAAIGSSITITNVTGSPQSGYNGTWVVTGSTDIGQYIITSTASSGGVATYTYRFAAPTNNNPPQVNYFITVSGTLNDNGGYNGTYPISSVNPGGQSFTVDGLNLPDSPPVDESATGVAVMSGLNLTFDPGAQTSPSQNAIFGSTTFAVNGGQVTIIGTTIIPIGAGTRQAVVFFITKTGYWTPASPPVTFTTTASANVINVTQLPIGPPDTVARAIAITEAGANGVPGANFYVIINPVSTTVNGVVTVSTSTIVYDNTSTGVNLSYTDAVLLDSQEVDIPGFNQFNLIELGSSAWCVPYSSRMFYGMQLNKVQNFNNMSFDGGYLNVRDPQPLGWGLYPTANEIQLVVSPITGDALYISNTTGSIQAKMGQISQTAYQDPYLVPIIQSNTGYSVRVSCSCPSGVRLGTLVLALTDLNAGNFTYNTSGLGTYGSFTVPLSDMSTQITTFTGPLLYSTIFTGVVSPSLQFTLWVQNMGVGADCLIDRIEVFPTLFPYLKTEVYGSYINKPESIDASGDGGIIDTSTENPQTCFGGFVMRERLYLMKTNSMYSTSDNPNSEPGGWSLTEISNRVGAVGINAFDTGEEWGVTACRSGIFGFDGGKPELLNLETLQLWQAINWNYGHTICIRNDINYRRILCAVPLPTGTSPEGVPTATVAWLPYAPYNPAPTTPNVIFMLNYRAIASFKEMLEAVGTHATMFGTLANPDMRRKWTIWQIPTPFMGTLTQGNLIDTPLLIGNGIDSSKIYELNPEQLSDDGAAIYSLYCTYSFVNAAKAATVPIFGYHTKRYTVLQSNLAGAGNLTLNMIPNDLFARYPYSIPGGINLNSPAQDDYFRSINCKGQRLFLEYSTDAVGSWFNLCKVLLTGRGDAWSSLNPTGGGNMGIS